MWRAIPGLLFLLLCVLFLWALEYKNIPSVARERLMEKPAPALQATGLSGDAGVSDFNKTPLPKPIFISFFASWCTPCLAEHPLITTLRKEQPITAIGIGFGDKRENITAWLEQHGNPYDYVALDESSKTSVEFGLKGVPESFLIDRQGIVRFAHRGVLTPEDVKHELIPLIQTYAK